MGAYEGEGASGPTLQKGGKEEISETGEEARWRGHYKEEIKFFCPERKTDKSYRNPSKPENIMC